MINNICTILNGGIYDLWKIRIRKKIGNLHQQAAGDSSDGQGHCLAAWLAS